MLRQSAKVAVHASVSGRQVDQRHLDLRFPKDIRYFFSDVFSGTARRSLCLNSPPAVSVHARTVDDEKVSNVLPAIDKGRLFETYDWLAIYMWGIDVCALN